MKEGSINFNFMLIPDNQAFKFADPPQKTFSYSPFPVVSKFSTPPLRRISNQWPYHSFNFHQYTNKLRHLCDKYRHRLPVSNTQSKSSSIFRFSRNEHPTKGFVFGFQSSRSNDSYCPIIERVYYAVVLQPTA